MTNDEKLKFIHKLTTRFQETCDNNNDAYTQGYMACLLDVIDDISENCEIEVERDSEWCCGK